MASRPGVPQTINGLSNWLRLLLGLIVVFALFHGSAMALGSDLGQAGLIVGLLVVAATLTAERILLRDTDHLPPSRRALGMPDTRGLLAASAICVVLLFVVLMFVPATGASVSFLPGWVSLLPGLFAQAGVAEEILFRGYLFGHLRRGRSFWRAATVSMLPFAAVHVLLFLTMPWPIALAALLLSVALSFPLAHLFELGGGTIWAPAMLHFVIQGTVKVLVFPGEGASIFPLVWMVASALIPWFSFLAVSRQLTANS
jgi:membrane protease YdiL (CAAX protease family)